MGSRIQLAKTLLYEKTANMNKTVQLARLIKNKTICRGLNVPDSVKKRDQAMSLRLSTRTRRRRQWWLHLPHSPYRRQSPSRRLANIRRGSAPPSPWARRERWRWGRRRAWRLRMRRGGSRSWSPLQPRRWASRSRPGPRGYSRTALHFLRCSWPWN